MSAVSLNSHLETQHDIFRSFVLNRDLEVNAEEEVKVYPANFSIATNAWQYPVIGCAGKASTKWNLRWHFADRHPPFQEKECIPGACAVGCR